MKTYEEMTARVLERVHTYERVQRQKRQRLNRGAAAVGCVCLAGAAGLGIWRSGVFRPLPGTESSQPEAPQGEMTVPADDAAATAPNSSSEGQMTTAPDSSGEQTTTSRWATTKEPQDPTESNQTPAKPDGKIIWCVNVVTGTAEQARRWDPAQCVTESRTAAETAAYFGRDLRQALADFWKKQAYPGSYTLCTVTPVENDAYSLVRRREDGQIVDDTATYSAEMMQLYEGAAFSERFTVSVTASRIAPPAAFADRRLLSNTDEVNQFKASDGETYDVKVYEVGKDKVVADFAVHGIYYRVTAEGEVNHAALRCFIELGIAG